MKCQQTKTAISSFNCQNRCPNVIVLMGIYFSKALTCMKIFLYIQKWLFLSRRRIPLATLLYEQLIHLT